MNTIIIEIIGKKEDGDLRVEVSMEGHCSLTSWCPYSLSIEEHIADTVEHFITRECLS